MSGLVSTFPLQDNIAFGKIEEWDNYRRRPMSQCMGDANRDLVKELDYPQFSRGKEHLFGWWPDESSLGLGQQANLRRVTARLGNGAELSVAN